MIRVVDGNAYFRRKLEADTSGLCLRNLYYEVEMSPNIEIWVWDGKHATKRRKAIYPQYKEGRQLANEDIWKAMELFQKVLLCSRAIQVRVPEYEGDDVVAAIALRVAQDGNPVLVESHDKDLLALAAHENIKVNRDPIPNVAPYDVRLYKTLVGDSSDKITGIPGFGEKAWLTCDRDRFRELLEQPGSWPTDVEKVMEEFRISKRCATWLVENEQLLRVMWRIVGFELPPWELVNDYSIAGKPDPATADNMLKQWLQ